MWGRENINIAAHTFDKQYMCCILWGTEPVVHPYFIFGSVIINFSLVSPSLGVQERMVEFGGAVDSLWGAWRAGYSTMCLKMDHISIVYPGGFRSPNKRKLREELNRIGNLGSRVP
jgi:hypothetical protein